MNHQIPFVFEEVLLPLIDHIRLIFEEILLYSSHHIPLIFEEVLSQGGYTVFINRSVRCLRLKLRLTLFRFTFLSNFPSYEAESTLLYLRPMARAIRTKRAAILIVDMKIKRRIKQSTEPSISISWRDLPSVNNSSLIKS